MNKLRQLFSNPEVRKRLFFTLALLVIYRLGVHISVPGVNAEAFAKNIGKAGDLLNVMDLFSGGALKKCSIFALGITPYITASIVLQLMGAVIPTLEHLQKKEGEAGRQKINQWTRYLTVFLAFIQGFVMVAPAAQGMGSAVVANPGIGFKLLVALTASAGTMLVMWIGEQITERGLGNGTSLLIFAGIVAGLPSATGDIGTKVLASLKGTSETPAGIYLVLLVVMIAVLLAVVLVENAYRRIPIHYARRVDSSRMASQRSSYMPLKVNTAGVMPVIFASSVIFFPATIAQFTQWDWLGKFSAYLNPQVHFGIYTLIFVSVVIFFAFFYTSIVFNPDETAENLKRAGGYVPGIRPGKETSAYLDGILSKLTFAGAIYLAVISLVPLLLMGKIPGLNFAFGGTSLLIVVGVAMDTAAQLESYQVMRNYDGFLERGRVRGRASFAGVAGNRGES